MPPPPVVRPKPTPVAPVGAIVLPRFGSSPNTGVFDRASGGACCTIGFGGAGLIFCAGRAISGAFAAGGSTGTRFNSGGRCACTACPPIGVIPPARGPGAPPRLIVITVAGSFEPKLPLGMNSTTAPTTRWSPSDATTIRRSPAGSCARTVRMSETASIRDLRDQLPTSNFQLPTLPKPKAESLEANAAHSPGNFATMPTFSTPASLSLSITSMRSCSCTPPSPRRKTCLSVFVRSACRIRSSRMSTRTGSFPI